MSDEQKTAEDTEQRAGTVAQGTEYNASNITVLEGLEAVRKRPGMYIGSTGERGLHHLVYEVVDNSVDEALAGYASEITVTLLDNGGVKVEDDGRGIPVDIHPTEGVAAVQVVMTVLHAGGKFGNGSYAVSGGLHGVGISVVNALSTRMDTEVRRDGYVWRISYENGVPVAPLEQGEPTDKTGTTQTFWPNADIFETVEFDFDTLRQRFHQMAFLNKSLKITLIDERETAVVEGDEVTGEDDATETKHTQVTYQYDNGLHDYVTHLIKTKKSEPVHEHPIYFEAEDKERVISVEVAMQWTNAYSESLHTFANTINTTEGGTHEEGFRTALTSIINKYARDKAILKEKDANLTGDDIREGLTAVISVKLGEPQFEGQTKTKLGNTEARTFVQQTTYAQLTDWLDMHPSEGKEIIRKAMQAQTARLAARKAREATRRKSVLESAAMPGKLKDCTSRKPEECEIFIVEGDSAGGSAVNGRDPNHQAIMPIRGKILNVEKARLDRALSSDSIQSLITAFGTGVGEEFDIDKLRYHKIVFMADADVDGQHIATLLLTLVYRYMRPLIEHGYIYLAMPPLYRLKWTNAEHEYVFSDKERDIKLEEGLAAGKRLPKAEGQGIQRYKGLGEMNDHELWDTTMNPETRTLKRVSIGEAAATDESFSVLMGEDVASRRSFIQRNAHDVRFLDI
ncbi:DNA topoisomerase (ATP-hydrolyzing) subunit B [Arcanobacterium haemolyticum]|uniref:DNA gyrase subunit B n=1 Tax=Arcanobacterium haemolyticum (strain ATCC 9345 / DSM 20595 / CCM 5947 / CCUG 17215 / LMG 16163 / NBRC 15585 / NCTC 8452 / 11018) TaxID=644284 RepID=D7BLH4_ARCHD|nr:DNA topoisomerase (ATP-hydrolyzing) subunit B [Arcanobacterium haemolyticum]ADH91773.1 DNA gyrase, B subunit [Arcanobacterium haemolyticum DSM 20595]QCX45979.1 DNA topoisomerase (ATP-hydrolyzing) subunit B [Arcanobacterium haemolyticum]SQH27438.1 DNA gyrase subunit B [Arcanobacterium haemolyticum]